MAAIEWHESNEFQPETGSILQFCQVNAIPSGLELDDNRLQVFIQQNALESLHDFLAHDLQREHGGVLVGKPFTDQENGVNFLVIHSAIPALETEGNSVHLQFTPETWSYISGIIDESYPDQMVVGWYHSHPGLGIFMSGTDRATQKAFYHHAWSVAVVADPIAKETGWFLGPECFRLASAQVISYIPPVSKEVIPETSEPEYALLEREYRQKQEAMEWRWLLPFGFWILGVLTLVWLRVKSRLKV